MFYFIDYLAASLLCSVTNKQKKCKLPLFKHTYEEQKSPWGIWVVGKDRHYPHRQGKK